MSLSETCCRSRCLARASSAVVTSALVALCGGLPSSAVAIVPVAEAPGLVRQPKVRRVSGERVRTRIVMADKSDLARLGAGRSFAGGVTGEAVLESNLVALWSAGSSGYRWRAADGLVVRNIHDDTRRALEGRSRGLPTSSRKLELWGAGGWRTAGYLTEVSYDDALVLSNLHANSAMSSFRGWPATGTVEGYAEMSSGGPNADHFKGIGTLLVGDLLSRAYQQGKDVRLLATPAAQPFYEKLGFDYARGSYRNRFQEASMTVAHDDALTILDKISREYAASPDTLRHPNVPLREAVASGERREPSW